MESKSKPIYHPKWGYRWSKPHRRSFTPAFTTTIDKGLVDALRSETGTKRIGWLVHDLLIGYLNSELRKQGKPEWKP